MSSASLNPVSYIEQKWDILHKAEYDVPKAWEELGVDPHDTSAISQLRETAKRIRNENIQPWYDYDSQMLVYGNKENPLAYFKPGGAMRAHIEPALRRIAKSLDFEELIACTAPWVVKPEELSKPLKVAKLLSSDFRQKDVPCSECVYYGEDTLNGLHIDYVPGAKGSRNIAKNLSFVPVRPFVGVLSPVVQSSDAEKTHLAFMELALGTSIIGMRDFNNDALVWNGRYTVIDAEEGLARIPKEEDIPHLDATYLRDHLSLSKRPASPDDLKSLIGRVNNLDLDLAEKVASEARIFFRDSDLESLSPQNPDLKPSIRIFAESGQQVLVYPTAREKKFFPIRSLVEMQLFHVDQVQSLRARAERIRDALTKSESGVFNAWSFIFAADPAFFKRFEAAYSARHSILNKEEGSSQIARQFGYLRLDSSSEDSFLSRLAELGGDPELVFPSSPTSDCFPCVFDKI